MTTKIRVSGFPSYAAEEEIAVCRSRIIRDVEEFLKKSKAKNVSLRVETSENESKKAYSSPRGKDEDEKTVQERAERYESRSPLYAFEQLVLPEETMRDILVAIEFSKVKNIVFEEWGLKLIEPFPRTALNFYGDPGTGKTMAAHAVAERLGCPILAASYAELESKFHGDGPKNVQSIFYAAQRDNAVLFIDEADSLLSRRLTNVTQGSEQAINSMRSQLLICLENFSGVVIFSTNLVQNYDRAFETRVKHVKFPMPDKDQLEKIWKRHIVESLPLSSCVSIGKLSETEGICGRDIKNAVIDAAVTVALDGRTEVTLQDFTNSILRIKEAKPTNKVKPLTKEEEPAVVNIVKRAIKNRK